MYAALADAGRTAGTAGPRADGLAGRSWAPLPDRYERIAGSGEAAAT